MTGFSSYCRDGRSAGRLTGPTSEMNREGGAETFFFFFTKQRAQNKKERKKKEIEKSFATRENDIKRVRLKKTLIVPHSLGYYLTGRRFCIHDLSTFMSTLYLP